MKELADLTAPAVITRKLLEKDVQKKCVEWMRSRGYWARKFSSQSQRSVPDYLFAHAASLKFKFACEFKRPGAPIIKETGFQSTEAQVEEQRAMRKAGWFVFECDNFETFKLTVQQFESMFAV